MIWVVSIGGAILFGSVLMGLLQTTRGLPFNQKANRFRWVLAAAALVIWEGFALGTPLLGHAVWVDLFGAGAILFAVGASYLHQIAAPPFPPNQSTATKTRRKKS